MTAMKKPKTRTEWISVEGNDAELEKKQTDAAESKDTNDEVASNQLTNDSDADEDTEEVKKNTLSG